jgi:6-phosphogluconolactonase
MNLPGSVITRKDGAAVATEAARLLAEALKSAIAARGKASLALSGGNTPRPAYEQLAAQAGVDWSKVSVFWIDERAVPPDHSRSNYRLAKESLLSRAPIPAENVHRMTGEAKDLARAARDYEAVLREVLGAAAGSVPVLDVAVVGIGDDGHTASLFPGGTAVHERTRLVLDVPAAPDKDREARLTVTAPVIEQIRTVFSLVVAKTKKGPLERIAAPTGSLDETPSRLYRSVHGALTWVVDEAALHG